LSDAGQDNQSQKPHPLREIVQPFIDAARAPRALWGNNLQYFVEGFIYFGILNYLVIYGIEYIGLDEIRAGWVASLLALGITFSQLMFGGLADRWGARRALLVALFVLFIGRAVLSASGSLDLPTEGTWSPALLVVLAGIGIIVLGYGFYEPASYTIVRQVTTAKTAAMGFAMLYALMNLGGWLPSFLWPLRESIGIVGVYWCFTGLTLATLIVAAIILTRRTMDRAVADARAERKREAGSSEVEPKEPPVDQSKMTRYEALVDWLVHHPVTDLRFTFFIFILIPVQTLFVHNWLTLPLYVSRVFKGTWLGDRYELVVNFNPLLVFIMVPIAAALTRKADVYRMMIVGTFIMAAPAFLLALEPSIWLLGAYIVIMTIGESIWQPRFLQYAAEIAPEGRTGAYMGVARFPWFLTKMITGLYAGWFLMRYVPAEGEIHSETMWLIYGAIAMISPVGLVFASRWMRKGFKTTA
jgi:MFS family permease